MGVGVRVHEVAAAAGCTSKDVRRHLMFLGVRTSSPSTMLPPIFAGLIVDWLRKYPPREPTTS